MPETRRPSPQTLAVLRALTAAPAEWRHGYELGRQLGLKAGSLYPILIRLSDRGLLEARWEQRSDETAGRPPRHRYRLTGAGREVAAQLVRAPAGRGPHELRAPAARREPARVRVAPRTAS